MLQRARQNGAAPGLVARLLASFCLSVIDVTAADAEAAADFWRLGSPLPLADRLCLALGVRLGLTVATADSALRSVVDGPAVIVLR